MLRYNIASFMCTIILRRVHVYVRYLFIYLVMCAAGVKFRCVCVCDFRHGIFCFFSQATFLIGFGPRAFRYI